MQPSVHSPSLPSVHFPSPVSYTTGAVSSHPSPIPTLDLKELKQAVLHRSLAHLTRRSPDLRVCPYEVPGGGVCRDKECEELHLSQLGKEPSGTSCSCCVCGLTERVDGVLSDPAGVADMEVAAYVHGILPRPWNGRCDMRAIEIALEGVRLRGGATDIGSRVREALGGLGIPMS